MSTNAEGGDGNNFIGFPHGTDGGSSSDLSIIGDYYQDTRDTLPNGGGDSQPNGGRNEESRFVYKTELLVREADLDVT